MQVEGIATAMLEEFGMSKREKSELLKSVREGIDWHETRSDTR